MTDSNVTRAGEWPTADRMVALGDTDAAQVLYFAFVYRWHEEAFTVWLDEIGLPLRELFGRGDALAVRASSADYPASAHLGDRLAGQIRVTGTDRGVVTVDTTWRRGETVIARVQTVHIATRFGGDEGFGRAPLFDELRAALDERTPPAA